MITLDGSQGEGGGQILRTALALSLCTGQPFRISKIRAGRAKPGLLRQHLTAVGAAEQVGSATVSGAEMGSQELTFRPKLVQAGTYTFAIGTTGSATLVLQTVLPALLTAEACTTLTCQGGTMNPAAPPFDFLHRAFAPQIQRLGVDLNLKHHTPGFYPAGGGEFQARIEPALKLAPFSLLEKGELRHQRATVYLANLSQTIADREIAHLQKLLSWPETSFHVQRCDDTPGMGNAIVLEESHEHVTEVATGFGERGVASERVAEAAVRALRQHQASRAVVGEHLADQLLIPFALAGAGEFLIGQPSSHTLTNAQTIAQFLEVKIRFHEDGEKAWRCVIGN